MWLRVLDRLNAGIRLAVGLLLAAMCLLALLQVLVRLVLTTFGVNLSAPWSEELGRSLMIWLIFLGTAYAFRSGQMVALQVLVNKLPAGLRRWADAAATLVVLGFVGLLVDVGLQGVGADERLREHAHHVADLLLLGGQLEVDHDCSTSSPIASVSSTETPWTRPRVRASRIHFSTG